MSTPRSAYSPQRVQLLRFCLVGVVNTGTFYGFYFALHPWLPYFTAYTAAFAASMVGSFFLNTYLTYRTRPTWRKFLLFPLTNLTNYTVTGIGVYTLVEWARINDRAAPLVAAAAAIPFTYVLSRRILLPAGAVPCSVRSGRCRRERAALSDETSST
nr:GtrA family protein [Streptomyces sp. NBC_00995]